MYIYLLLYLFIYEVLAGIKVIDSGMLPLEHNSVGLQFFIDIENDQRIVPCTVRTWTKKCCLTDADEDDCDAMYVAGDNVELLKPNDRATLVQVYPTIVQHDQVGYCEFNLEYKCGKACRSSDVINIPFDTRIFVEGTYGNLLKYYIRDRKKEDCDTLDEDSLESCVPVRCDLKYCGARPFYDSNINKCIKAPTCDGDPDKPLPDIVYVPKINVCRDLENPLTVNDIYGINTGLYTSVDQPHAVDEVKVEVTSNCSTISQNLQFLKDVLFGKLCPVAIKGADTSEYTSCCKSAILKILASIVGLCALLLSCICCLHTSVGLYQKWSDGSLQECWRELMDKLKKKQKNECAHVFSSINTDVRNALLREVIVKDIPIELRESVVDVCDRMEREVRWKKRYRGTDVGSQISLRGEVPSVASTSSTSDCDEKEKLLK